jgi:hypothetical protein
MNTRADCDQQRDKLKVSRSQSLVAVVTGIRIGTILDEDFDVPISPLRRAKQGCPLIVVAGIRIRAALKECPNHPYISVIRRQLQ